MNLLAIADNYIPPDYMRSGLGPLADQGVSIEVRQWAYASLLDLQHANLAIEKGGPEAVPLPAELCGDLADFDIVVVQFAPLSRQFIGAARKLKVIDVRKQGEWDNGHVMSPSLRSKASLYSIRRAGLHVRWPNARSA